MKGSVAFGLLFVAWLAMVGIAVVVIVIPLLVRMLVVGMVFAGMALLCVLLIGVFSRPRRRPAYPPPYCTSAPWQVDSVNTGREYRYQLPAAVSDWPATVVTVDPDGQWVPEPAVPPQPVTDAWPSPSMRPDVEPVLVQRRRASGRLQRHLGHRGH